MIGHDWALLVIQWVVVLLGIIYLFLITGVTVALVRRSIRSLTWAIRGACACLVVQALILTLRTVYAGWTSFNVPNVVNVVLLVGILCAASVGRRRAIERSQREAEETVRKWTGAGR